MQRERVLLDRHNPLQGQDDVQLLSIYRLDRNSLIVLEGLVRYHIIHATRRALSHMMQLLVALRFFATGGMQSSVGDGLNISQPSVSRCVHRVSRAIISLCPRFITMPCGRNLDITKENFYEMAAFPDIIGCIDGTHLRIQAPTDHKEVLCESKRLP